MDDGPGNAPATLVQYPECCAGALSVPMRNGQAAAGDKRECYARRRNAFHDSYVMVSDGRWLYNARAFSRAMQRELDIPELRLGRA